MTVRLALRCATAASPHERILILPADRSYPSHPCLVPWQSQKKFRLLENAPGALPDDKADYKDDYQRCVPVDKYGNDKNDPNVWYTELCNKCSALTPSFEWQGANLDEGKWKTARPAVVSEFGNRRKQARARHRGTQCHQNATKPRTGVRQAIGPPIPNGAVGDAKLNGEEQKALKYTWETVHFNDAIGKPIEDGYTRQRVKGGDGTIVTFLTNGTGTDHRHLKTKLREHAIGKHKPRSTTSAVSGLSLLSTVANTNGVEDKQTKDIPSKRQKILEKIE